MTLHETQCIAYIRKAERYLLDDDSQNAADDYLARSRELLLDIVSKRPGERGWIRCRVIASSKVHRSGLTRTAGRRKRESKKGSHRSGCLF